jgi:methyltransferase
VWSCGNADALGGGNPDDGHAPAAPSWRGGRNTRRLLAKGAVESGAGHYPFIVALHAAWLAGLWWFASGGGVNLFWLAVYGVL